MIKTIKLAKSMDFTVSCATQNEHGDEVEFLQSSSYNICWKISAVGPELDLEELTFNQNVTVHKIEHFLQNYIDNRTAGEPGQASALCAWRAAARAASSSVSLSR